MVDKVGKRVEVPKQWWTSSGRVAKGGHLDQTGVDPRDQSRTDVEGYRGRARLGRWKSWRKPRMNAREERFGKKLDVRDSSGFPVAGAKGERMNRSRMARESRTPVRLNLRRRSRGNRIKSSEAVSVGFLLTTWSDGFSDLREAFSESIRLPSFADRRKLQLKKPSTERRSSVAHPTRDPTRVGGRRL